MNLLRCLMRANGFALAQAKAFDFSYLRFCVRLDTIVSIVAVSLPVRFPA
jgi:hypothetical protein